MRACRYTAGQYRPERLDQTRRRRHRGRGTRRRALEEDQETSVIKRHRADWNDLHADFPYLAWPLDPQPVFAHRRRVPARLADRRRDFGQQLAPRQLVQIETRRAGRMSQKRGGVATELQNVQLVVAQHAGRSVTRQCNAVGGAPQQVLFTGFHGTLRRLGHRERGRLRVWLPACASFFRNIELPPLGYALFRIDLETFVVERGKQIR